jgi:P-type E1-E2 ATPase
LGVISTKDAIKEESFDAVAELKKLGLSVSLLTGDNAVVAHSVGEALGVDEVIAEATPSEKANAVKASRCGGGVIMVGDGVNDAPALTVADVGIAIGGGCDVAMESAQVVLVRSSLYDAVSAVKLGRRVLKAIKQNLFFAFVYNLIGIPMAAGLFGFNISPMFGAFAMSVSSITVVLNSLRINRFANYNLQKRDYYADISENVGEDKN